jgi:hypothetical protein
MKNLYSKILYNVETLKPDELEALLKEHELNTNALYLKTKFNDPRSLETLKAIIKSELYPPLKGNL